jgi:CheY-like chemotaxis protein
VVGCSPGKLGRVRITVSDTGAGLPPEKLDQLFQPFNRLGQESSTEEGTGIGLVVTKRLIEQMGGAVAVESTVGVGTTFRIELPSAPPPDVEMEPPQATPSVVHFPAGEPVRTLLYVEDNPANLKLIEQLVRRRPDLRLLTAVDGPSGIEIARSLLPDIILMDINLPGMSGITAMQILRADPVTAHIPVIALSANAMPRDVEKGLASGFFRYLTKPIKVAEFMAAVDIDLSLAKKSVAQGR